MALLKTFLRGLLTQIPRFFAGTFSTKIVDFFKDFLIEIWVFFKDIPQLTFLSKILDFLNFYELLGLKSMFWRIYLGETFWKEIVEEIVDFEKKLKFSKFHEFLRFFRAFRPKI